MRIDVTKTTDEILGEIGARLRAYRLQQNRSIEDVAQEAGVGARTLLRAERGEHPTLETLIKVLRALGRVEALDTFLPVAVVSPIQLAQLQGVERQRAGASREPKPAKDDDEGQ